MLRFPQNQSKLIYYLAVMLLSRLLPHPPNLTPTLGACFLLGSQFSNNKYLVIIMLLTTMLTDCLLAIFQHYPWWGDFTWFTYSGVILCWVVGYYWRRFLPDRVLALGMLLASTFYWLWTNFGIWLFGTYYPKTLAGLLTCYGMGIPFLANQLVGEGIGIMLFLILPLLLTEFFFKPTNKSRALNQCKVNSK